MLSSLYCVKDSKVGLYMPPFALANDTQALRAFAYSVNDTTVQTSLSLYPSDFDLYRIGQFDDVSGQVIRFDSPEFICSAISLHKIPADFRAGVVPARKIAEQPPTAAGRG